MYEEGLIEVTGGRVWYQKFDQNGKGTPLVVLHGGPGSSCFSLQGLKELSKDRPVILYDQLGCGRSDRPTDKSLWRIERFVEELAQVRTALNLDEVHILGHSWGTTLAAAYALTQPVGIKSIIFSSPCLSAPLWEQDQKRNLKELPIEVQETIKRCEENETTDSEEFEAAIEVFSKHFVNRLEKMPEWLEKRPHEYRNSEVYNIMWGPSEFTVLGNLKEFDCTPQLKDITCPTLYTCGRFDEATPETTEYYSSLSPNSKFHVFEKSAHMAYIEEPEEYLSVMGDFLKSIA
ncbi:proline iminopeptidase [Bacillus sp. AFS076308]|uniref:proline-specific peptidase family protein n=1 Tax=unclassified Bacillus (in: firmicutes) TaxID=185979 RepID=UPI000BF258C1|nr:MULTISPECIES: proline-specific peptidase family protein [unclassified Bacillus (in: firmicutes)]PFN77614.1 proline iminopeptidase [Bacillus sp. AFS076308]PGV45305.1 proline iminopeptidase [Bacillus sp. AFS037270]